MRSLRPPVQLIQVRARVHRLRKASASIADAGAASATGINFLSPKR